MRRHLAAHRVRVLAVGLAALVPAAAWIAPAARAAVGTRPGIRAVSFSASGFLDAVAATSARNAWAVGQAGPAFSSKPRTLIARWDGRAWKRVPSPTPASGGSLYGVTVTSAHTGWAVGETGSPTGTKTKTLILRWDGTAWTQVPSPTPAGGATLYSVAVTSARSAWAVGWAYRGQKTLILRWNGTAWTQVPSPTPHGGALLDGVAATSATSAWAVGRAYDGRTAKTLILRWNGTAWTPVPSPDPAGGGALSDVAATSARNAWAVGWAYRGQKSLILRWNGTAWTQVPSPTPHGGATLYSVAVTSTRNAWAVGQTGTLSTPKPRTLDLHWNGTTWR